jgi:hypothetical protein
MADPLRSFGGTNFRATRPRLRKRGVSLGTTHRGNFRPNVKLDTSHMHDMRVARGTTGQLQRRRLSAQRRVTRR